MTTSKKFFLLSVFFIIFFSRPTFAIDGMGQVIQINTQLTKIVGTPTWLLIVRNEKNGQIFPYMYDFKENTNTWLAFTYGNAYRITTSELQFSSGRTIHNFCSLEKGVIVGKSMMVTLTGKLSTNRDLFHCSVATY